MKSLAVTKKSILVCLVIFMLLSSIIQFGQILSFNPHVFELSIFLLLFYNIIHYSLAKKSLLILSLYLPTLIFSIINSIIEGGISNFIVFLFYYLSILACFSSGYNLGNDSSLIRLINYYVLVSFLINFTGIIIPNENNIYPGFSGVFLNPNVYGMFCSASIVFVYLCLVSIDAKWSFYIKFYFLMNLIGLLSSVSRTAISALIMSISFYYFMIFSIRFGKKIKKKWLYSIILIIFSFSFALYFGAFDKFIKKSSGLDDISNGRLNLWIKAYNSLKFYGHGHEYYGIGEQATHNNYLNIGVVFGASVMIALSVFWILIIFNSVYLYSRYKVKIIAASVSIFIFSIYYWLFEVGSGFVFIWMALIALGYSQLKINDLKYRGY